VIVAAATLVAALVAPATADAASPRRTAAEQRTQLTWRRCSGGECASLTVPLDYDYPDNGRTIKVALFRVRATKPKQRIGSLLINPGGPGASGVDFARDSARQLPKELRARFDIVGFDPRGTGRTIPVKCEDNLDPVLHLDYSPDTPDERAALEAGVQQLAQSCAARSGDILPYVSSEATARDMDRIRDAVGDKKLTYVGYSYGTYLGTLYAQLFPNKVRAMVLDGAIDPNLSRVDLTIDQARGFESDLKRFLDRCAQDRECAFNNDGDPSAAYDQLVARVDASPIPGGDGRTLGPGEFDYGVAQALYSGQAGDSELAQALRSAQRGDGGAMLELTDQYTDRQADGTYSSELPGYWAIGCVDGPSTGGPDAFEAAEPEVAAAAPRMGVSNLNDTLVCAYWPVPPVPRAPVMVDGTPPILVIGTTGDPATPLKWAQNLSQDLSNSVLLVAEGSQHTSFALAFNSCVDTKAVKYLVDLAPPPNGTHCAGHGGSPPG
jgi:pimeloyl-ACP methyl ester carboxylesterase